MFGDPWTRHSACCFYSAPPVQLFLYWDFRHLDKFFSSPEHLLGLYLVGKDFVQIWPIPTVTPQQGTYFSSRGHTCLEGPNQERLETLFTDRAVFSLTGPVLHPILALTLLSQTMPDWSKSLNRNIATAAVDFLLTEHLEQMGVLVNISCNLMGLLKVFCIISHCDRQADSLSLCKDAYSLFQQRKGL